MGQPLSCCSSDKLAEERAERKQSTASSGSDSRNKDLSACSGNGRDLPQPNSMYGSGVLLTSREGRNLRHNKSTSSISSGITNGFVLSPRNLKMYTEEFQSPEKAGDKESSLSRSQAATPVATDDGSPRRSPEKPSKVTPLNSTMRRKDPAVSVARVLNKSHSKSPPLPTTVKCTGDSKLQQQAVPLSASCKASKIGKRAQQWLSTRAAEAPQVDQMQATSLREPLPGVHIYVIGDSEGQNAAYKTSAGAHKKPAETTMLPASSSPTSRISTSPVASGSQSRSRTKKFRSLKHRASLPGHMGIQSTPNQRSQKSMQARLTRAESSLEMTSHKLSHIKLRSMTPTDKMSSFHLSKRKQNQAGNWESKRKSASTSSNKCSSFQRSDDSARKLNGVVPQGSGQSPREDSKTNVNNGATADAGQRGSQRSKSLLRTVSSHSLQLVESIKTSLIGDGDQSTQAEKEELLAAPDSGQEDDEIATKTRPTRRDSRKQASASAKNSKKSKRVSFSSSVVKYSIRRASAGKRTSYSSSSKSVSSKTPKRSATSVKKRVRFTDLASADII